MVTKWTSIADTRLAIDRSLSNTDYSCQKVSWDDVCRGTQHESLSCWGANITDTRLRTMDGKSLYTLRSQNWNEKLGLIKASQLALIVGNCEGYNSELRNITLKDFLHSPYVNGGRYCGLGPDVSLAAPSLVEKISIRFQTVFMPVGCNSENSSKALQFAPEAYNYFARSDEHPRNFVVLATTQGLSVQTDGEGSKGFF